MKADVLKKHHYWIIAGVSLVLVLVAFFSLGSVGTAIESKQGDIKKAEGETAKAMAPGKVALDAIEKQKKTLEDKKDLLWRENWNLQKALFTWPAAPGNPFAEYEALKFGADLPSWNAEDSKYDAFRKADVYKAAYEQMAAEIAPSKFNGGWHSVLADRYVAAWVDRKPEPRQIWLALEDIWVTRELLRPIHKVNEDAREFKHITDIGIANTPLKKTFANTSWMVEVEVITKDQAKMVTGKLTNRTKQMQLLGTDNRLKLKVWLDPESKNPFDLEVQGEYVPGESTIVIPPQPIGAGFNVTEIVKLEQVPDSRTVPIRQVEKVSLTLVPNQFGAYSKAVLLPPTFWPDDAAGADVAAGGAAPAVSGPPVASGREGDRGISAVPSGPLMSGGASGRGTIDSATTEKRKRYLEVNEQLRRIPVAIKLVLDHRYVQDVMVAYTNSPLRLQLVQYHWARYRGDLGVTPDSGTPGSPLASTGGIISSDTPMIQGSLGEEFGRGGRGRGGREGRIDAPPPPSALPSGPVPSMPSIPGLAGGVLTSVSEAQANSSLVELYLFGIVTIYEKHEAKKDAAGTPTPPAPPKPAEPTKADATPPPATPPTTPPATPPKKEEAPPPTAPMPPAKKD